MKYYSYVPVVLFFLPLIISGCDFNKTNNQAVRIDLDNRGRGRFASDTPQQQMEKILEEPQPARSQPSGAEPPGETSSGGTRATTSQEQKTLKDPVLGEKVYFANCSLCHEKGIAGAPLFGVQKEWANRILKGREKLILNAINGYQGNKGVMPAKGGNPALSDAEVEAAVAYMLESLNHQ